MGEKAIGLRRRFMWRNENNQSGNGKIM